MQRGKQQLEELPDTLDWTRDISSRRQSTLDFSTRPYLFRAASNSRYYPAIGASPNHAGRLFRVRDINCPEPQIAQLAGLRALAVPRECRESSAWGFEEPPFGLCGGSSGIYPNLRHLGDREIREKRPPDINSEAGWS